NDTLDGGPGIDHCDGGGIPGVHIDLFTNCETTVPPGAGNFCTDQIKNGTETDVDCGGGSCLACAVGLACLTGSDCVTGICSNSVCRSPEVPDAGVPDAGPDVEVPDAAEDVAVPDAGVPEEDVAVPDAGHVTCTTDAECNDNNECTEDRCVNGICH